MASEYVCDNCGKRESAALAMFVGWAKPREWLQHVETTKDGKKVMRTLDACSEKCKNALADELGIPTHVESTESVENTLQFAD